MEESGGCCSGCGGGDAVEEVGAEAEDGGEARGHFFGEAETDGGGEERER